MLTAIRRLIKDKPYLIWWTKNYEHLSDEAIVEAVLNYGDFDDTVKIPDILTLAAMKAYALGRRAKWKDYVDLYFTMQKYHGIKKIVEKAKQIYKTEFNEKLFRSQLAYFKDINYSEEVIYMPGMEIKNTTIEKGLIDFSLS